MQWTAAVTAEPRAGVEAGTLLGSGPRHAADLAGEGTIALARPGGRVEVRAARDGLPSLLPDGAAVAPLQAQMDDGDRADGDRVVLGALRVTGHIAPGMDLRATGPVRVEGNIDRSEIRAGGELRVDGRAGGAHLVGGSLVDLRGRVFTPLRGVALEIDALVGLVDQLVGESARRGAGVAPALAIRTLAAARFADLEQRLARALGMIVAARRSWPGLCDGLAAAVAAAHRAVAEPETAADPLARLTAAAGFLAAAVPPRRPRPDVGIRLPAATGCSIETAGTLRFVGSGARDCDIVVGGDLIAMGTGGAIRGGTATVGGRVRVREISGREGSLARVVLDGSRASDDEVLSVGVLGPGVEVVVGGTPMRFDRKCADVRIGVAGGRPILQAV